MLRFPYPRSQVGPLLDWSELSLGTSKEQIQLGLHTGAAQQSENKVQGVLMMKDCGIPSAHRQMPIGLSAWPRQWAQVRLVLMEDALDCHSLDGFTERFT